MTTPVKTITLRLAGAALMAATAASVVTLPAPLAAQDAASAEARLKKVEAEVRALQRKVFPGGDGKFFEPQIAPGTPTPATTTTTAAPATTPVTDILVRLDALESQLRSLTARSEEQANALSLMEQRLVVLETAANAPVTPAATTPAITPAPVGPVLQPAATTPAPAPKPTVQTAAVTPAPKPAAPPAPAPAPVPTSPAPSAARLAAVQAIAKPQTTDAGDDEYTYGFRLWNAGLFPEARQQLVKYVEQYPNHAKISYGRNLLGRAFLDDKMPEDAGKWFLRNYLANKAGERAPDSLLYLGKTQVLLKEPKKACIALAEFVDTYPLIAAGRLADEYKAILAQAKCS